MTYLWPELLAFALVVPLLAVARWWLLRRRSTSASAIRFAGGANDLPAPVSRWRQHLPPAVLLLAVLTLVLAAARPMAPITLPSQRQTVVLAVDVSRSMKARDVEPNRMKASQQAAKAFIERLPREIRIGVVSFSDAAHVVQKPTTQRDDAVEAVERLQIQGGTAIGEGIVVALSAIFPDADFEEWEAPDRPATRVSLQQGRASRHKAATPKTVPPGSDRSAVIVLMTDGQNTAGPDPMDAAQLAARHGIKVFTVGYGTKEGEVPGGESLTVRVSLDEDTLKKVADVTGGEYFRAPDGAALARVYEGLKGRLVLEKADTELTAVFAAVGAALLMIGVALSTWWFGRVA